MCCFSPACYWLVPVPKPYRSGLATRSVCASCGNSSCLLSICHHCLHTTTRPVTPNIDWSRIRARRSKIAASLATVQEKKEQRAQKRRERQQQQIKPAACGEESELDCSQLTSADLNQPSRASSTDSLCAPPISVASACAVLDQASRTAPSADELLEWREEAVLRSLSWAAQFVSRSREDDFTSNGGDIIFLYRFLVNRCCGRVKQAALSTISVMLSKWERNVASSVLDLYAECELLQNYVECLHAKMGLRQQEAYSEQEVSRMQQRVATELSHHGVEDICRFNPTVGVGLPVSQAGYCLPCGQYQRIEDRVACPTCSSTLSHPLDLDALCESLVWTSVYRDVGVYPLECSNATCYLDNSLRFIRHCRPYRALQQMGADQFRFQCYLITHLTFVLSTSADSAGSSWYSHELDRRLLMEEWLFLSANVDTVIQMDDPELVGEFVAALRLLGARDGDACMLKGYAYLLQAELSGKQTGGWVGSGASFYKRYHAAYCACIALADMATDGPAQLSREVVQHFTQAAPQKCR